MSSTPSSSARQAVADILDRHSIMAQQSEYDRGVCIAALLSVREILAPLPETLAEEDYLAQARQRVALHADHYRDSDGRYTSGRSVIIGILDELYQL